MSATVNRSGSPVWSCLVCNHSLQDLYVLPCYHRFCESCLHHWIGIYVTKYGGQARQYPCQLCWRHFHAPPEGIASFKQNYYVTQLQSQMENLAMDSKVLALCEQMTDNSLPPEGSTTSTDMDSSTGDGVIVNMDSNTNVIPCDYRSHAPYPNRAAHSCIMYGGAGHPHFF